MRKRRIYGIWGWPQISIEESACRLRSFLADHLVEIEEDGAKRWTLDQPRVVPWAFISWDVGI